MAEPLKLLFSPVKLRQVGFYIKKYYKPFDEQKFLTHFKTREWKDAELKARVRLVTLALHACFPDDYAKAIAILVPASSHEQWGYVGVFFPDYVELYGMDHWQISMDALAEFTKTSTSEFAVRKFILLDEQRAMKQMLLWSKSENHHVRRLSSEGCRPLLPWGARLNSFVKNPQPVIRILENLKNDPELYVRKSVANNLNDISKNHPDFVIEIAMRWHGQSEHTDWIVNHALRSLLKSGNKKALEIFGHHDASGFQVLEMLIERKNIRIGEELYFSFTIENSSQKKRICRIEFAIDYAKANGGSSQKVFQISKTEIPVGKVLFRRKQRFTDFTTRKHYPGKHTLHILLNGERLKSAVFNLLPEA